MGTSSSDVFIVCSRNKIFHYTGNTPPSASFSINPSNGNLSTLFTFDATGCFDEEAIIKDLEVRWDWDNDGNWDTPYSISKIATHQFAETGRHTVQLEVKDSEGLTDIVSKQLDVKVLPSIKDYDCTKLLGTWDLWAWGSVVLQWPPVHFVWTFDEATKDVAYGIENGHEAIQAFWDEEKSLYRIFYPAGDNLLSWYVDVNENHMAGYFYERTINSFLQV